jgi:hypothetical protein
MKTKPLVKKSARQSSAVAPRVRVKKPLSADRPKGTRQPTANDFLAKLEALQKPFRIRGEIVTASRAESDLLARRIAGEAA